MSDWPEGHPKLALLWKIVRISTGVLLILVGFVGLFLPILQGWLMIFAGLALLSTHSPAARRVMRWIKTKLRIPHKPTPEDLADAEAEAEAARKAEGDRRAKG